MEVMEKDVHGWKVEESMMKVEDDGVFVLEESRGRCLFVVEKMTSKDKTLFEIEVMDIALLIIHDVSELFVCVEDAFDESEELFVVVVEGVDSL